MKPGRIRAQSASHAHLMRAFIDDAKVIQSAEGRRMSEVMQTFINHTAASMRAALFHGISDRAAAAREAELVAKAERHLTTASARGCVTRMVEHLTQALAQDPVDFIGPVFMELLAHDGLGQFFTPREVSRLIAQLNLPASPEDAPMETGYITLQEPTCGVAGMVLASNEVLRDRGFDPTTQTRWCMIELDRTAVDAAYIQASLTNVPAMVYWANTLSLEIYARWPTPQLLKVTARDMAA